MRLRSIAIATACALAPLAVFAHGMPPLPVHGGQVEEVNENWVELVIHGDQVLLYVLDEARKPVPSSQLSGTATVLVGGKPYRVELTPAEANSLQGRLPVAASEQAAATVSLTINGQHASGRFAKG